LFRVHSPRRDVKPAERTSPCPSRRQPRGALGRQWSTVFLAVCPGCRAASTRVRNTVLLCQYRSMSVKCRLGQCGSSEGSRLRSGGLARSRTSMRPSMPWTFCRPRSLAGRRSRCQLWCGVAGHRHAPAGLCRGQFPNTAFLRSLTVSGSLASSLPPKKRIRKKVQFVAGGSNEFVPCDNPAYPRS
jgi:hypothetical protein